LLGGPFAFQHSSTQTSFGPEIWVITVEIMASGKVEQTAGGSAFREIIESKKPVVFDGAMGTTLYEQVLLFKACSDVSVPTETLLQTVSMEKRPHRNEWA
jgi:hypothetical protein